MMEVKKLKVKELAPNSWNPNVIDNRKCYMMELDPHYCDVIIKRWENLTGKEAVKLDD